MRYGYRLFRVRGRARVGARVTVWGRTRVRVRVRVGVRAGVRVGVGVGVRVSSRCEIWISPSSSSEERALTRSVPSEGEGWGEG